MKSIEGKKEMRIKRHRRPRFGTISETTKTVKRKAETEGRCADKYQIVDKPRAVDRRPRWEYLDEKQVEIRKKWSTMTKDEKNSLLPQIPEVVSLNREDLEYKKKVQREIDEYRSFIIQKNGGEADNNPPDDDSIFYHSRPSPGALKELNLGRKKWQKEKEREFSETLKADESDNGAHVVTEAPIVTTSPTKPPIRVHYFNSPEQEQLRQQWSSLSQERKQEYLPLIPVIIPVLPEHSSHIGKLHEDINNYRTYTIIQQPQEKDLMPPDDAFIVKTLFKRPERPTSHVNSPNMIHRIHLYIKKDSITTAQVYILGGFSTDNLICYLRRSDSTILAQQSFRRLDGSFLTMSKQPKNAYINCQVFNTNSGMISIED